MIENPENYKWGIFYFNKQDTRIFVPKINQRLGWTVNFANPFAYLIIIGIIVLMVFIGR